MQRHYNWAAAGAAAVAMASHRKHLDTEGEQTCCNWQLLRPPVLPHCMHQDLVADGLLLVLTRLQAGPGIWPYPCWYMRPLLDLKP